MVVEDYELNVSLQEYFYFQECPQKFRIHRILNPIPFKTNFESSVYSIDHYRLQGYSSTFLDGIELHEFFKNFHELYYQSIVEEMMPENFKKDNPRGIFWLKQREKFHQLQNKNLWFPFKTEFKIMTEKQRGIIDCIEFCMDGESLRLIDYKPKPHVNDMESILFYCNLLYEYQLTNDLDIPEIKEAGCYYYRLGEYQLIKLTNKQYQQISEKISNVLEEIRNVNLTFNKSNCYNCQYPDVCKIEQLRRK
ncbi:MAG: PD-(D/E)XK nuclease family protein [Candidatus Heimdallarchaeota archaeon]